MATIGEPLFGLFAHEQKGRCAKGSSGLSVLDLAGLGGGGGESRRALDRNEYKTMSNKGQGQIAV